MSDSCENLHTYSPLTVTISDTEKRAKIFAALGDPTRLRIIEMLARQEEMSGSKVYPGQELVWLCFVTILKF